MSVPMQAGRGRQRALRAGVAGLAGLTVAGGLLFALASDRLRLPAQAADRPPAPASQAPRVELVSEYPDTVRVPEELLAAKRLRVAEVRPAPAPEPLRLPGSLALDTNRLARVHCLFAGQVIGLGALTHDGQTRPLRYGDPVRAGDILAVVWSKDIGEKKSELVDALSRLAVDQALLDRYLNVEKGVIAERTVQDARRNVEADLIAVARAERTLRSWRLTEGEIAAVRREAEQLIRQQKPQPDREVEKTWAETAVRAPFDGVIVEKNVAAGDIVDPTLDLFKVADLSRLQVLANVYEEDLPALHRLPAGRRNWKINLKSDPLGEPIAGSFELIGQVIDPTQRSGTVMGWVDNARGTLRAGQFITATVEVPGDRGLVAVPAGAVIEEDNTESVFVEVGSGRREFRRQPVAVVRRGREWIVIRAEPTDAERRQGARPLAAGERVIVAGALELAAELDSLKSSGRQ